MFSGVEKVVTFEYNLELKRVLVHKIMEINEGGEGAGTDCPFRVPNKEGYGLTNKEEPGCIRDTK